MNNYKEALKKATALAEAARNYLEVFPTIEEALRLAEVDQSARSRSSHNGSVSPQAPLKKPVVKSNSKNAKPDVPQSVPYPDIMVPEILELVAEATISNTRYFFKMSPLVIREALYEVVGERMQQDDIAIVNKIKNCKKWKKKWGEVPSKADKATIQPPGNQSWKDFCKEVFENILSQQHYLLDSSDDELPLTKWTVPPSKKRPRPVEEDILSDEVKADDDHDKYLKVVRELENLDTEEEIRDAILVVSSLDNEFLAGQVHRHFHCSTFWKTLVYPIGELKTQKSFLNHALGFMGLERSRFFSNRELNLQLNRALLVIVAESEDRSAPQMVVDEMGSYSTRALSAVLNGSSDNVMEGLREFFKGMRPELWNSLSPLILRVALRLLNLRANDTAVDHLNGLYDNVASKLKPKHPDNLDRIGIVLLFYTLAGWVGDPIITQLGLRVCTLVAGTDASGFAKIVLQGNQKPDASRRRGGK